MIQKICLYYRYHDIGIWFGYDRKNNCASGIWGGWGYDRDVIENYVYIMDITILRYDGDMIEIIIVYRGYGVMILSCGYDTQKYVYIIDIT